VPLADVVQTQPVDPDTSWMQPAPGPDPWATAPAAGSPQEAAQTAATAELAQQSRVAAQPAPPAPKQGLAYPGQAGAGAPGANAGIVAPQLGLLPGGQARGWSPTTQSVEQRQAVQYSPEAMAATGEQFAAHAETAQAGLAGQAALGEQQNLIAKKMGLWDEATDAETRLRRQHDLNEAKAYHEKISTLMQDAAADKTDPMKWWKDDMTTGQKVLFALGSAIAGFGYGYSGRGINPAQVINDRIQASVAAQRDAHKNKLEGIESARTQFGQLHQIMGDSESAYLADVAAKRQSLIGYLQLRAQDETAPAAQRMNAANAAQGLADFQADTLRKLDETQAQSIMSKSESKFAAGGPGKEQVGVAVTLRDGTTKVIPVDDAKKLGLMPGDQAAVRKDVAEATKAEADAAVAPAKAQADLARLKTTTGGSNLEQIAPNVHSTEWDVLGRNTQGTKSFDQDQTNQDWNARLVADYHATHPGLRLQSDELIERVLGPYMVDPGDSEQTVRRKVERYLSTRKDISPGEGATDE